MARGRFTYTMDAKGRLAIPQDWRMELQAHSKRPPVLTNLVGAPALALYSPERWEEIEKRLDGLSQVQPDVQQLRRMLRLGIAGRALRRAGAPLDRRGFARVRGARAGRRRRGRRHAHRALGQDALRARAGHCEGSRHRARTNRGGFGSVKASSAKTARDGGTEGRSFGRERDGVIRSMRARHAERMGARSGLPHAAPEHPCPDSSR